MSTFYSLTGLCPDCSIKLNYHSKKREIKRIKKQNKSNKHKGLPSDHIDEPSASTSSSLSAENLQDNRSENVNSESAENSQAAQDRQSSANDVAHKQLEQIFWSKSKTVEEKTREEEFDEYLADLLL